MENSKKTQPYIVCITGAAGFIGYNLISSIISGGLFEEHEEIELRLLQLESQLSELEGIRQQILDCGPIKVKSFVFGSNPEIIFQDIDIGIFLGSAARRPGMERDELISINSLIFKDQGIALNVAAKPQTQILVAATPVTTIIQQTKILNQNFKTFVGQHKYINTLVILYENSQKEYHGFDITRPLENNQFHQPVNWVPVRCHYKSDNLGQQKFFQLRNLSETQYADYKFMQINDQNVVDLVDKTWLEKELQDYIQNRGANLMKHYKRIMNLSCIHAIKHHLNAWKYGTKQGEFISFVVIVENGQYGIPKDMVFSVPVKCKNFEFEVVKGLQLDQNQMEQIALNIKEINQESQQAMAVIGEDSK